MIDRAVDPETWKVPAYVTAAIRTNVPHNSKATFCEAIVFAAVSAAATHHDWLRQCSKQENRCWEQLLHTQH
jgi:hypothetical protein